MLSKFRGLQHQVALVLLGLVDLVELRRHLPHGLLRIIIVMVIMIIIIIIAIVIVIVIIIIVIIIIIIIIVVEVIISTVVSFTQPMMRMALEMVMPLWSWSYR